VFLLLQTSKEYRKNNEIVMLRLPPEAGQVVTKPAYRQAGIGSKGAVKTFWKDKFQLIKVAVSSWDRI
jgi:hypothetical protein